MKVKFVDSVAPLGCSAGKAGGAKFFLCRVATPTPRPRFSAAGVILLARLKPVKESTALDHEFQNGFRGLRGTIDSVFTVKQLVKKRSEHGLPTWLLLIDLVEAFDRVPRELLWQVMIKQGEAGITSSLAAHNRESQVRARGHHTDA